MSGRVGAILLAAGQGRRLGHDKSVTSIAGQPVLSYGLRALLACGEVEKVVVTVRAKVSTSQTTPINAGGTLTGNGTAVGGAAAGGAAAGGGAVARGGAAVGR
ncbi:MAG: NTP transferase domain-containing protein, partial [Verrucomicrobiota bacterium]